MAFAAAIGIPTGCPEPTLRIMPHRVMPHRVMPHRVMPHRVMPTASCDETQDHARQIGNQGGGLSRNADAATQRYD
jgi:hypothetical protein